MQTTTNVPKLVIRPEFEDKLKALRIKTKFLNNCNKVEWPYPSKGYFRRNQNEAITWFRFIVNSFHWDSTPEGYYYWSNIADK